MELQGFEDDQSLVSDAKSAIKNLATPEIQDGIATQDVSLQEEIFFGGIWWNFNWAED